MDSKKTSSGKAAEALRREERLKAALKANMGRRKAQSRARVAEQEEKEAESSDKG